MPTITKFFCICGTDKPEDAKHYDGAVGYEALICKRCGRMYDHLGEHPADVFSCHHVGITEAQANLFSTEVLVADRKRMKKALYEIREAIKIKKIREIIDNALINTK